MVGDCGVDPTTGVDSFPVAGAGALGAVPSAVGGLVSLVPGELEGVPAAVVATGELAVGVPAASVAAALPEALGSAPQPHSAATLATRPKNWTEDNRCPSMFIRTPSP
jgi:hypothetical protein